MRFIFLLLTLAFVASAATLQAQRDERFGVKMNILSTVSVKTVNVVPEYAITPRISAAVGFYRTHNYHYKDNVFFGVAITPEARVHLFPSYLKGLYAGPFFRYRRLTWTIPSLSSDADFISLGGGITAGYQFLIKKLVMLDFYIGPAFSGHNIKVNAGNIEDFKVPITASVGVRGGVALGFAFF